MNKETLQNYNERLNTNNTSLDDVLDTINNLTEISGTLEITENGEVDVTTYKMVRVGVYTPPNLQDKSVEIKNNGTQTIKADEGYDGLNNVEITTNVEGGTEEFGEYIQDGLIAWFEGEDELVNNKLINRKNTDSIYLMTTVPYVKAPSTNPFTKAYGSKGISNNMTQCYITSKDYYNSGYTFEAVGEITNKYNSSSDSGGWLFGGNTNTAFGIGIRETTGEISFFNASNCTKEKTYTGYYGKRFGASVYTKDIGTRTAPSEIYDLECSVNGEPYYSVKQKTASTKTSKYNGLPILCYYCFDSSGDKYATNGHLYSLRIYNRKLTEEEIAHNHEIDKRRFNLEK